MSKRLALGLIAIAACATSSSAQVWTQLADMPGLGRHHPVNFVLDGYAYSATGTTTGAGVTDDFYRYDPTTDTWDVLPDFPGADRSYAYGGTYNGKGYLGFGIGSAYLNDLWEYDPESELWTQLASLPGVGRTHPAFVITDDGKIFVGMGGAQSGNLRDWWEYSIAGNSWIRRADLPGPQRHHPFYFNVGNVPYAGFGHGAGIFKDFYRFDPIALTWTRMVDFPGEQRVAGTQLTHDGTGYVLSGQGVDHDYLDTGEFWRYDEIGDSWLQLTPHPGSGRWAPGSFVIGDIVYLTAGTSTVREEHDLWMFDLSGTTNVDGPELATGFSFTVSPNPVSGDQIRLVGLPNGLNRATVQLLGPDGRRVQVLENQSEMLQLPSGLASGRYFVNLSLPGGSNATQQITILR